MVQRKLASPGHRDRAYSVRASARRTIRTNNRNCLFFHHRFIGGGYRLFLRLSVLRNLRRLFFTARS